ncbi:putative porin [Robiginitalea aurantiaca]|uniref:Porin n=1 Tax=Robiginitalea aurantiaca TaxID=3056915 RepID=A0ABT7WFB3_9FLAO|nr:putative porin [Robiginitalea aurantiaca]MDM9631604.1 putative porin [Robiginitalea aurantiaca]
MRSLLVLLILLFGLSVSGQEDVRPSSRKQDTSRLKKRAFNPEKSEDPADTLTIKDYKIISHARDTTYLDTSLTIQKEYRYNYLRRDDFELMPFSNIGQPYNRLGVNLNKVKWYPQIGARARHFNYYEIEDISYYNVATPMTELFFKTTLERGQLLDAVLTFNTSRRLNFSIAYKGFRSLGKYREDEMTSGNFRTTLNYSTENGLYRMRTHYVSQDIRGQENGGLLNKEDQFESGNPDFTDRSRVDVRFRNVTNRVNGKRFFLDHQLRLLGGRKDSISRRGSLNLGHQFSYESKYYQYIQSDNNNEYFGELIFQPVDDKAFLKTYYNELRLGLENRVLGNLVAKVSLFNYSYYFTSIIQTPDVIIPNRLTGEELVGGAEWKKDFGPFRIQADGGIGLSGDLTGSFLDASIEVPIRDKHVFTAGIHHSARKPDFNFLLYQSDYLNYNWDNSGVFENEQVQSLFGRFASDTWGTLEGQLSSVENYTYFRSVADSDAIEEGEERSFIRPFQESSRINHLRIKYEKEFKWRKWALNNTLLYQEVDQPDNVLNLPSLITRNTLYFSSDVFKKAMFIQTGITFKYFTSYYTDGYNPLMAEFYVQDREENGNFPLLDFFINARIRQARIYFKLEHFNSPFSESRFYAAPDYPYRDFVIRFGLVWNFFS